MREQFTLAASAEILAGIDAAASQAGLSRGQAFEDFLTFVRCSLAGHTMEEEYLATVRKGYDKGQPGERGIDRIARTFGRLVQAMEETGQDVLGDIFAGGITYAEQGQFFTPDSICELMAALTVPNDSGDSPKTVNDPACGSGRILLAVARKHPSWVYTGQDSDHRCAQMAAINMGLNGLRGWAVWQNSLTLQCHRVYRIGLNPLSGGVITEVPVDQSPFNQAAPAPPKTPANPGDESSSDSSPDDREPPPPNPQQLGLF